MANRQAAWIGSGAPSRIVRFAAGLAGVLLFAGVAGAQDRQIIPVGNGLAGTLCVFYGLDTMVDSAIGGDDTTHPTGIDSGPNGICESIPVPDDIHPSDITFGQGSEFRTLIRPSIADGLCRSSVTLLGDDVQRVLNPTLDPPGTGTPRQVGVRPDPDATIATVAGGDDVVTSLVCPDSDGTIETPLMGDDQLSADNDPRCDICAFGATACITPGPDDVLDSVAAGTDEEREYVSTGANGRSESTAAGSDLQAIPVGEGHENTVCVDTGADGIAQTTLCGNGIDDANENGISDDDLFECDDGDTISGDGCSDICQPEICGDGFFHDPTEECDDGNLTSEDGCSATCILEFCGDGVEQGGLGEQCDDGGSNSDILPDACRTNCLDAHCGDGVEDPGNSEPCDDGNTKSNDDCIVALGCTLAVCGDGFRHTKGTPPFEECDDGNTMSGDGCDASCELEPTPGCGDGNIDSVCTAGNVGPACTMNADCDTSLGAGDGTCTTEQCDDGNNSSKDDCLNNCVNATCGDGIEKTLGTPPFEECDDANLQPGDGCSATCESECGNGAIDGSCSQGTVGAFCGDNDDCDTSLGAGDGICITEECDTAIDGVCTVIPPTCSAECTLASCGNGVVECSEECDLAALNGVTGSGCTLACARNLIGTREVTGGNECPSAWTLDSPPQDVAFTSQRCTDGAACDFDGSSSNGSCTFSVGICLNRPPVGGCVAGPIDSVDLRGLKPAIAFHGEAADVLTPALADLTNDVANAPGRCSAGLKRKNCSTASDCDRYLGADDGVCDFATGVEYDPALEDGTNQATACTPGVPVVVPSGETLRLKMQVRRGGGLKGDKDNMRLICEP